MRQIMCILPVFVLVGGLSVAPLAAPDDTAPLPVTPPESGGFSPDFTLDFGMGYGLSYAGEVSFAYFVPGQGDELEDYYERLGLGITKNSLTVNLTGGVVLTPRFGFRLTIPAGMVEAKPDVPLPGLVDTEFGLGDIGAGVYYVASTEGRKRPKLIVSAEWQSDNAEYSSLGDGVTHVRTGAALNKYISNKTFLIGTGDYTFRGDSNGVDVGDLYGFSIGVGAVNRNRKGKTSVELRYSEVDEATYDGRQLVEPYEDLSLVVNAFALLKSSSVSMYVTRLNDFAIEETTVGFNWNFNLIR